MRVLNQAISKTSAKYSLAADSHELSHFLEFATKLLAPNTKVPGFRPGKAPAEMIQKHVDQTSLQNEFLNHGINELYSNSLSELKLKTAGEPKITITKFVPFSTLELAVDVSVISNIKLPDYKNFKLSLQARPVTTEQLNLNIEALRQRAAKLTASKKPAKLGDQVVIDFDGIDAKTKQRLAPASAKDYRLVLGENGLIKGFEENLVGLKPGEQKEFTLTFPKDYHDKSFVSRKVTFKTKLTEVNTVDLPKLDDSFAKSVGPFKDVGELNSELKKQLSLENDRQATIDLDNAILNELALKTQVDIPENMVDDEVNRLSEEAKQQAIYRGQTWAEFLSSQGQSEETYQAELAKVAKNRIKAGLAIGEIATAEKIQVTEDELNQQIAELKQRYSDEQMRSELDKEANRRELLMRMVTEKVLNNIKAALKPAKTIL